MIHHLIITPALDNNKAPRHSSRGPLFQVAYNGINIVTATTEPCLDGARALKAMGMTGKLELWDDVVPYCRLHADIDKAAKLTVREGDEPPRLVKYVPFAPRSTLDGDLRPRGTQITPTPKTPSMDSSMPFAEQSSGGTS